MPKIVLAVCALVLVIAAAGTLWLDRTESTAIVPGGLSGGSIYATNFPDLNGRSQSLGQWSQKILVINFWATWCGPCKEEMPLLTKMQAEFGGKNVQIIGIAADSSLNVAKFVEKNDVGYPLLPEEGQAIEFSKRLGNKLGLLPFTAFVLPGGSIAYTRLGVMQEDEFRQIVINFIKK